MEMEAQRGRLNSKAFLPHDHSQDGFQQSTFSYTVDTKLALSTESTLIRRPTTERKGTRRTSCFFLNQPLTTDNGWWLVGRRLYGTGATHTCFAANSVWHCPSHQHKSTSLLHTEPRLLSPTEKSKCQEGIFTLAL